MTRRVDLRFGPDDEGELYLLAKANGKIWKRRRRAAARPRASPVSRASPVNVVAHYDFEHPVPGSPPSRTSGASGTTST